MSRTRIKQGLVTILLFSIAAIGFVGIREYLSWRHKKNNYVKVGLSILKDNPSLKKPKNIVEVLRNEPFSVVLSCEDEDGLKRFAVYGNGEEIFSKDMKGRKSAWWDVSTKSPLTGERTYIVIAEDVNGEKRAGDVKVRVKEEEYKGSYKPPFSHIGFSIR